MTNKEQLNELIPNYAFNKNEMDSYKKLCDRDNTIIKALMKEEGLDNYNQGDYTAKISIQQRQTLNEDKLLDVIKDMDRLDLIKTKEYVDMDLLEKALYNGEIDAGDIDSCMTIKEVVTLKVTHNKE